MKKILILLFGIIMISLASAFTPIYSLNIEGHEDDNLNLYYNNTIHMYWVVTGYHSVYNQWHQGETISDIEELAEYAKNATDLMPEGKKVIFDTSLIYWLSKNESDNCVNEEGFTETRCLWWEKGKKDVSEKYDLFFKKFKELGGEIDFLVLDFEDNMRAGQIGMEWQETNETNYLQRWTDILNDPRFESSGFSNRPSLCFRKICYDYIFNQLKGLGFIGNSSEDILDLIYYVPYDEDSLLQWDSLMFKRSSEYVKDSSCDVAKKYYPNIKCSNYDQITWKTEYQYFDAGFHERSKYGVGGLAGNRQSPSIYGQMIDNGQIEGIPYPNTSFNVFRKEVNNLRALKLAYPKIPLVPWFCYKKWDHNKLRESFLYDELVYHALLTGSEGILHWNPHISTHGFQYIGDEQQDMHLDSLVHEFDLLIGEGKRKPLFNSQIAWNSPTVMTCMRNLDTGKIVCRITNENEGQWIASTIGIKYFILKLLR